MVETLPIEIAPIAAAASKLRVTFFIVKSPFFFEKPDHRHRRMLRTRNEWSPLIVDGFLNRVLEAADRILNLASDWFNLPPPLSVLALGPLSGAQNLPEP